MLSRTLRIVYWVVDQKYFCITIVKHCNSIENLDNIPLSLSLFLFSVHSSPGCRNHVLCSGVCS